MLLLPSAEGIAVSCQRPETLRKSGERTLFGVLFKSFTYSARMISSEFYGLSYEIINRECSHVGIK